MNNSLPYSIKVWLFTAVAGPIFTTSYFFANNYTLHSINEILIRVMMTILFAIGCSVPFCAVFAGINKFLFQLEQKIQITKVMANVIGLLLGILPLMLIQKKMDFFHLESFDYIWIYASVFSLGIWSFEIIKEEKKVERPKVRGDILDDDLDFVN